MILRDRVAIVTASGSGIGRAGAAKMASEGATVILADLSPERSEEAASQIRHAGDRAEAHPTDVTTPRPWGRRSRRLCRGTGGSTSCTATRASRWVAG